MIRFIRIDVNGAVRANPMSVLDGFVKSFLVVLVAFWLFTISEYFFMGQINTAILVFLTLLIPIFVIVSEFRHVLKPKRLLLCSYTIPLLEHKILSRPKLPKANPKDSILLQSLKHL